MIKTYTYSITIDGESVPKYKAEWLGTELPQKPYTLDTFAHLTTPVKFTNIPDRESKTLQVKLLDCSRFTETKKGVHQLTMIDMKYWLCNMVRWKNTQNKIR